MTKKTTTTALRLLWASTAFLLLSGCPVTGLPEPPQPECTHASECPDGKLCGPAGVCIDECRGDRDCPRGLTCTEGTCQAAPGFCGRDSDCATGEVCAVNGKCVLPCNTTTDCGTGFVCLAGACLDNSGGCGRDVECGPSEVCAADGSCVAPCTMDGQCAMDEQCSAGACVKKQTACAGAAECQAPEVCSPNGLCQESCTSPSECPNGQTCAGGFCAPLPATCAGAGDCPASESCGQAMVCTDKCLSTRDCKDGLLCTDGACEPPPASCVVAADCSSGQACSPAGSCVTACTQPTDCAGSDECSAGACVPTGAAWAKVQGAITLTGITDMSGIAVRVRNSAAAVEVATAMDGTWSGAGLPAGRYNVVIDAPSVREGVLELDVAAQGGQTVTVPTQTLTPVGTITGRVTLQGAANHQGTQLAVVMANAGATTDAMGDFTITNVPVGTWQLAASAGGYAASAANGIMVQWNQTTAVPAFSLSPLPVMNNTTFAFLSVPPPTANANASWVYTAVAGGGGVTNPSYAVVSGPAGFTIDSATGVVTWTPSPGMAGGTFYVTLSARGGGMTVFQIFFVDVTSPTPPLFELDAWRLSQSPDASWTWDGNRVVSVLGTAADGGATSFTVGQNALSVPAVGAELLNGGALTGFSLPGGSGTFTGARGPFGAIGATWTGGTISAVAPASGYALAGAPALRRVASASVTNLVTIGQVTPETWPITAISGLGPLTGVSVATGVATALTDTELADSTASWTPSSLTSSCLVNASGTVTIAITANDATTITTAGGLAGVFAAGSRYFVGNCSGGTARFTFTDSAATFPAFATNVRADLYLGDQPLLSCDPVSPNTATTFECDLSVTQYADLMKLPTSGQYGIGTTAGVEITLTSAGAGFAAPVAARVAPEDSYSSGLVLTGSTADSVTYRPSLGNALDLTVGQRFRLLTTGSPYTTNVTLSFASGTLAGSHVGETVTIDAANRRYTVTANTASSVTVAVPWNHFPLSNAWTGSVGAVAAGGPELVITDVTGGLPPVVGLQLVDAANGVSTFGTITASTGTQVTAVLNTGTNVVRDALSDLAAGQPWGWGQPGSSGWIHVELPLAGSPNFAPDGLIGQAVALERYVTARGSVRDNGPASLTVDFQSGGSLDAVLASSAGDRVLLGNGQGDYTVTVTDGSASWTPGALVGQWLVAGNAAAGYVRSNTATTVELVIEDIARLASLTPGAAYGFAPPDPFLCSGSAGYVPATVTLTGATLTPNAYSRLYWAGSSYAQVLGNDATSLQLGVCANQFQGFINSIGKLGLATANAAQANVFLDDTGATHTPGALAGRQLFLVDQGTTLSGTIANNTATSLELQLSTSTFFSVDPPSLGGERYGVLDANGWIQVTLQGTFAALAGSLANRFIALVNDDYSSTRGYLVQSNTASSVTLHLPINELDSYLLYQGQLEYGWLTWGEGLEVRVTALAPTWQPGELVGQRLDVGGYDFEVLANTATTVTVLAPSLSSSYSRVLLDPATLRSPASDVSAIVALPGGEALVARELDNGTHSLLVRYGTGGEVARYPHVDATRVLTLSPKPVLTGTIASQVSTGAGYTQTVTGAGWTPGALRGAVVRARPATSLNWNATVVVDNTADTLTTLDGIASSGSLFQLEPATYTVSGTTLTPGALTGKVLHIGGRPCTVRGNTATEVSLYPDLDDDELPAAVSVPNTQALIDDRPGATRTYALASDGANGAWVATASGLWHFDGTGFTRYDEVATATPLASGTVASFSTNSITDTSAAFTPDALAGAVVRVRGEVFDVAGNTAQTLFLSSSFYSGTGYSPPLPGEAYTVAKGTGFTSVRSVSAAGGALWVGTTTGLHHRQGTTWTQYTVENTESSYRANDGLFSDTVTGIYALSATDVFTWTGTSGSLRRLTGSTWTPLTVASSESSPGARDGLPGDAVNAVISRGADLFFGTDSGAAKLSGTTWTRYGPTTHPDWTYVYSLGFSPTGQLWLGTYYGVFEVP